MEKIDCPLCNGTSFTLLERVKDRLNPNSEEQYNIVKCTCGFIFLNPRPDEMDAAVYYQSDAYDPHISDTGDVYHKTYDIVRKIALYLKYKTIEKYARNGVLLDIGGGNGEFCRYMESRGWEVTLMDSSEKARQNAETLGIKTIADFSQIDADSQFDLITLLHSLEHIHDLESLFNNLKKHLKPHGFLFIAVPNILANERRFYPETWAPYDAPRHLYHFSPDTLERLLNDRGYHIIYSLPLYQDTPYNILISMEEKTIPNILKAVYVWVVTWGKILFKGNYYASSREVVCTLKQ